MEFFLQHWVFCHPKTLLLYWLFNNDYVAFNQAEDETFDIYEQLCNTKIICGLIDVITTGEFEVGLIY